MTAPPPVKTGKRSERLAVEGKSNLKENQQHPQCRFSKGMIPAYEVAASPSGPRRKVSLKFSFSNDQQAKGASLNPNAPIFTMQKRRMSRPSQSSTPTHFMIDPSGFGMMPFTGWMTRRFPNEVDYSGIRQSEKGRGFQKWCKTRMEPTPRPGSRAVPIVAPPQNEEQKLSRDEPVPYPVIVVSPAVEDSSASEEDEGHFSDNERSR